MEEIDRIDKALAALPSLRERLKRFAAVGLDTRLAEKTLIDSEARLFEAATSMVATATATAEGVRATSMEGGALLNDEDKAKLPNGQMLQGLNLIQATLTRRLHRAADHITFAARAATAEIDSTRNRWIPKQAEAEQNYEKILRTLKAEGHDGTEFVSIQAQVERLRPKEAERTTRLQRLTDLNIQRRDLLVRWESTKAADFRSLQQAARRVSRQLEGRVRVNVRRSRQLGQLETALRKHAPGNINQALERLRALETSVCWILPRPSERALPSWLENMDLHRPLPKRSLKVAPP
jgi:hypothetical protein